MDVGAGRMFANDMLMLKRNLLKSTIEGLPAFRWSSRPRSPVSHDACRSCTCSQAGQGNGARRPLLRRLALRLAPPFEETGTHG